ncbi:hypothetical protein JCM21714_4044 [Gracilibacillus boraciitolerans JCM 21714]|uniref:Uncharacterized protein n=1 Tax=Gracilibacillus boraciitolerans JCM 21714 TaxID=1298598 RepID=W4VQ09_9BACI|nr:hypothetical protein [Gracilibacillus boraciitolerans]GAE94849.1 hypothetical protein JCM21714_4044 [Gracilibacillus boraciitolerans JCM 21714]
MVYEQNKDKNFEILSVAVDGQGPEVVKPYVEGTTFPRYIRYPEKFGSEIDFDWQKEQLKKEKEEEEQRRNQGLVCGPDGCFIPS